MHNIDLSIVVLSYNTKELLRGCLRSIYKTVSKSLSYEIIVVDNASTDGSAKEIENLIRQYGGENLKSIVNKKNLGFSKANNLGVKQSVGRYILFLNADTLIYPKTLEPMIKFMERCKEAGVATCRVELPNGRLDDSCHRGFPTPWRSFCHFSGLAKLFPRTTLFGGYGMGYMNLDKIHQIDSCSGAFMMVRKTAGDQIGWWDEDFFWYGDDLDFCYRLKEKGWKIYFVPNVKILHYKGVSGGIKKISKHLTTASRETRIRVTNSRFEAMKIFYNKHYQNKYPFFIRWLVFLGIDLKRWFALKALEPV